MTLAPWIQLTPTWILLLPLVRDVNLEEELRSGLHKGLHGLEADGSSHLLGGLVNDRAPLVRLLFLLVLELPLKNENFGIPEK